MSVASLAQGNGCALSSGDRFFVRTYFFQPPMMGMNQLQPNPQMMGMSQPQMNPQMIMNPQMMGMAQSTMYPQMMGMAQPQMNPQMMGMAQLKQLRSADRSLCGRM